MFIPVVRKLRSITPCTVLILKIRMGMMGMRGPLISQQQKVTERAAPMMSAERTGAEAQEYSTPETGYSVNNSIFITRPKLSRTHHPS